MKIDVWSDFACPFCYIGKRHLEAALSSYPEAEVIFHSFELDPHSAIHHEEDIHQLIATKYGISYEQSKANNQQVIQMAQTVGLTYDFDNLKHTNTFTAHRIAHLAKEKGLGNEFVEAAMHAYFTEGVFLNDEAAFIAIGKKIGLADNDISRVFHSQEYLAQVRLDETKAVELGIQGVPFFLINEQYALSGAQPIAEFEKVLKRVAETLTSSQTTTPAPTCTDNSCQF